MVELVTTISIMALMVYLASQTRKAIRMTEDIEKKRQLVDMDFQNMVRGNLNYENDNSEILERGV